MTETSAESSVEGASGLRVGARFGSRESEDRWTPSVQGLLKEFRGQGPTVAGELIAVLLRSHGDYGEERIKNVLLASGRLTTLGAERSAREHLQGASSWWDPERPMLQAIRRTPSPLGPQHRDLLPFGERQVPAGRFGKADRWHAATVTEPPRVGSPRSSDRVRDYPTSDQCRVHGYGARLHHRSGAPNVDVLALRFTPLVAGVSHLDLGSWLALVRRPPAAAHTPGTRSARSPWRPENRPGPARRWSQIDKDACRRSRAAAHVGGRPGEHQGED